eukprot:2166242-Prymnesium_polylepis.1
MALRAREQQVRGSALLEYPGYTMMAHLTPRFEAAKAIKSRTTVQLIVRLSFVAPSAETAVRCRSGRIGRSGASPAAERSLLSQHSLLQQWLALSSRHRDQTS